MSQRRKANTHLVTHNRSSVANNYNTRHSITHLASQRNSVTFKVCEMKHGLKKYKPITMGLYNTIEYLKEKIAQSFNISIPLRKFFLEILDEKNGQWKVIDDSDSSVTINKLELRSGSILSIEYYDDQVSNDRRSPYSTSVSYENDELLLKLCRKPMDRTDHIELNILSSSTLGQLRKQAYNKLNKLSKDQPIYRWNKDTWVMFDSGMDDIKIHVLSFQSLAFISIDYAEENFNSKLPSGLCGLANLGSTCFMNSVFQCLSNIPEFTERILALNDEVNAPIIGEYTKLIKKMWSGKYQEIEPSALLDNINDNLPRYTSYRQQDAQEFMNHFLHLIHAELSTKETLITDLFYGQIRSTVKCLQCQQIEISNESISFLPLPITNYNQRTVLYVKANGEQHLHSTQVDSSVSEVGDLIDCFIEQHESTMNRKQILVVQLVDNLVENEYKTWNSLRTIHDDKLAFIECPEELDHEKLIWCRFYDHSTGKPFRAPNLLTCPTQNCRYTDLSDQIEQLLGHLCSMTDATVSDCFLYWSNQDRETHQLSIQANVNETLPRLTAINIEMTPKYVDIYKKYYSIDHSTDNSALTSLLSDFFREESVDGDYHCLKCPKHTKARQKSDLCLPLPHVLIIQLKRFTYDVHSNDKIDTFISFPLHGLDLNPYVIKDNIPKHANNASTKYDLVAVSNHTGSLTSGHYITYAKNIQDGNWYSFDDRYVTQLNGNDDVVTKNAYILIYVQKS